MSDIKLKTCHFCKRHDTLEIDSYEDGRKPWFYVRCKECLACGPILDTEEGAIDAWNMRAVPEPQRWIPVTERLPKRDDRVLVYIPEIGGANCSIQISKGWSMKYVSHWMPLPEPPKEESL